MIQNLLFYITLIYFPLHQNLKPKNFNFNLINFLINKEVSY